MLTAPQAALAMLVVAISLLAAVSDLRTGLVSNRLVLSGLVSVLVAMVVLPLSTGEASGLPELMLAGLIGGVACLVVPLALYLTRGLGGGDLKLLTMCGVGLGPTLGLEAQLYAFGLGCVFAVGRAIYAGVLWRTLRGSTTLLANQLVPVRLRRAVAPQALTPIRFAPFILAGVSTAVAMHWQAP